MFKAHEPISMWDYTEKRCQACGKDATYKKVLTGAGAYGYVAFFFMQCPLCGKVMCRNCGGNHEWATWFGEREAPSV